MVNLNSLQSTEVTKKTNNILLWLDKLILIFILIFLATLTNSIFLNQVGYFGALFFVLLKFIITRENPFKLTGLEIAFLLYIFALILSSIFSVNQSQSFNNLLKRILLIPIVYTISSSSNDIKKIRLFFRMYLGFSLISIIIYLFFAAEYYIKNLYQFQQSGPSVFQYPITASEIMSFTIIFLFAFLINEKQDIKLKLVTLFFFIISLLALFATYKRTGWIGTAAGIFLILLIKKKWFLLIPLVLIVITILIFEQDKSELIILQDKGNNYENILKIKTQGHASSILSDENDFWIADFENGLLKYSINNSSQIHLKSKTNFEAPIVDFKKIDDTLYLAFLVDTRFNLLKLQNDKLIKINEFTSPGFTIDYDLLNKSLFIMDKDSGLTIINNLFQPDERIRLLKFNDKTHQSFSDYNNFDLDSNFIVFSSNKEKQILYFPISEIINYSTEKSFTNNILKTKSDINYFKYDNHILFISDVESFKMFKLDSTGFHIFYENYQLKNVINILREKNELILLDTFGKIYSLSINNDEIKITNTFQLDFVPFNISYRNDNLFLSKVKRSRIASIFDPYNQSNFTRMELWRAGLKMFAEHPVFGVGDIDLGKLYIKYKNYYDKELLGHMHNNYIHFLVTLGSFGFIIVMFLLIKIFLLNIKIYNSVKNIPFASSYALGTLVGFVSFLFAGLTEWNFGDQEIITLVWFTLGLNLSIYFLYRKENLKSH